MYEIILNLCTFVIRLVTQMCICDDITHHRQQLILVHVTFSNTAEFGNWEISRANNF